MARFGIVAAPAVSAARRESPETEVDQVVTCERTFTMRYLLLRSAVLLAGAVTVASAETPVSPNVAIGTGRPETIERTVYLDSVVLEEIKKSNPERYARIRGVMASASEMCQPNAARTWALADVQPAGCSSMFLKTSYPPRREIGFQIDDTWYIAHVIVRDAPALLKAEPGKVVPADRSK